MEELRKLRERRNHGGTYKGARVSSLTHTHTIILSLHLIDNYTSGLEGREGKERVEKLQGKKKEK